MIKRSAEDRNTIYICTPWGRYIFRRWRGHLFKVFGQYICGWGLWKYVGFYKP